MDNTKQQQVQQSTQPVQQPAQSVTPPVQQPISVGRTKEMPTAPTEWVSPSTPEVVLPQEVKEAGIEVKPIMPSVSQVAQQVGVQHAKEATPAPSIKVEPLGMKTPRSVLTQLKNAHKKVSDGFSWLVRLVIKEQDKREKGVSL